MVLGLGLVTALALVAELVSVGSHGQAADRSSYNGSTNRTGRYVVLDSDAENLSTRDRRRLIDVYLRDRRRGTTTPVAIRPDGKVARSSTQGVISPNGRYVAYCSVDPRIVRPDSFDASDLDPEHEDTDVFVRDLRTGRTKRASSTPTGRPGNDYSCSPSVADDGDVVFRTSATNLLRRDRDGYDDVVLWDWKSGRLRKLVPWSGAHREYVISGDSSTVAVMTGFALVRGDTNRLMEPYVLRRDLRKPRWQRALHRADGSPLAATCDAAGLDLSHDGRYLTASCRDGAIAEPALPERATYLWLVDRRTDRATVVNPTDVTDYPSTVHQAAVSDDGRTVVYTAPSLGYGGTPREQDDEVFTWRRGRGVQLLTAGAAIAWRPFGLDLSGDGRHVLFTSDSEELSAKDVGTNQSDLYTVGLP